MFQAVELKLGKTSVKGVKSCALELQTKYYSAMLDMWIVSSSFVDDGDKKMVQHVGKQCCGLILLFDSNDVRTSKLTS